MRVQVRKKIAGEFKIFHDCTFKRDFYIIGAALTKLVLQTFISTLTQYSDDLRTMAKAIAIQESNGTHFWPGAGTGTASHKRYPLREKAGVGGGYGVMQLTDRKLLTLASIWNWQENVRTAMAEIKLRYDAGVTHLNAHPAGVTATMKRLEGYNRYNGGLEDRYHWWSLGPAQNGGVPQGWTKFGYVVCPGGSTNGFRDYNNDEIADPPGNPYNIDMGPEGANNCVGRAARYADNCYLLE